jgi:hypothetical protein
MTINNIIDLSIDPPFSTVLTDEQLVIFRELDEKETYNDTIVQEIIKQYDLRLLEAEKCHLETYVYIARHQLRDERKEAKIKEMEAQGWQRLTKEVAKELNGKKILLHAKQSADWFTVKVENIYKVYVRPNDGAVCLMKPRARRYGTFLSSLDDPMYKLV